MWVFYVRLESKKRRPSKKGIRHPKLVYKTIRIHALLPSVKVILRPKGRIRGKQNCEISLLREVVITGLAFPTKAIVKNKGAELTHDFSILCYPFYKVVTFFSLLFLLLWEEWRALCARQQLFNILQLVKRLSFLWQNKIPFVTLCPPETVKVPHLWIHKNTSPSCYRCRTPPCYEIPATTWQEVQGWRWDQKYATVASWLKTNNFILLKQIEKKL